MLDKAHGSEAEPNALEDDGGRVGIRAPVLQLHAAVLLPPLVPEYREVRHCAEPISGSLAAQTIALDVPAQEADVNKLLIMRTLRFPTGGKFW